jgi:hypothetical protein
MRPSVRFEVLLDDVVQFIKGFFGVHALVALTVPEWAKSHRVAGLVHIESLAQLSHLLEHLLQLSGRRLLTHESDAFAVQLSRCLEVVLPSQENFPFCSVYDDSYAAPLAAPRCASVPGGGPPTIPAFWGHFRLLQGLQRNQLREVEAAAA